MEHLVYLGARGLTLSVKDGRLRVEPKHRITPEVEDRIRSNRETLIDVLQDTDPWRERRELYGRLARGEE